MSVQAERCAIYPVWPEAWKTLEDSGGKLHKGQFVRTDSGKLLVGQGMEAQDLAPMEFLSKQAMLDYFNESTTGVKAPSF